jgi:type VI secretion system protein ImpC
MEKGRMQFDFTLGKSRRARRRPEDDQPFRILVLGNLSGHARTPPTTPLTRRAPIFIDIDNLPKVFAGLAPRLNYTLDGAPVTIAFDAIDDFHPDRLFERLTPFVALRKLRAELNDSTLYRRAALALGASPSGEAIPPGAGAEEDAANIERLLGRKPAAMPVAAGATGFDIDSWLRGVVAPHVVPDITHQQRQLIAAVDAAVAEQMRRVLHHPEFQALEVTWRGIESMVRELEIGETLQLFVADVSREELLHDIEANGHDLTQSTLYRQLCGADTEPPDGHRWSLLVGDYALGSSAEDVRLLAALGAMAAQAGAPLLAAARLDILGCTRVEDLSEPKSWKSNDGETQARWNDLRKSAAAPWIGLALPRVLSRLPYGAQSDPIAAFAFEEMPAARDHHAYLWGSPAFALALLAAKAFQQDGWGMDLGGQLDVTGLPSHTYREDGEAQQQPCAEVLMSQSAGEAILARGIMPLLSYRNRDAARLLRWQSIAEPAQPLQGALGITEY